MMRCPVPDDDDEYEVFKRRLRVVERWVGGGFGEDADYDTVHYHLGRLEEWMEEVGCDGLTVCAAVAG
jgi:hypothetical protein